MKEPNSPADQYARETETSRAMVTLMTCFLQREGLWKKFQEYAIPVLEEELAKREDAECKTQKPQW